MDSSTLPGTRCYCRCTRCGGPVDPYAANGEGLWVVGEQHDDYRRPVMEPGDFPGFSVYGCPVCKSRWFALNDTDTGRVLGCGHFMPEYVDYCAVCGKRTREQTEPCD